MINLWVRQVGSQWNIFMYDIPLCFSDMNKQISISLKTTIFIRQQSLYVSLSNIFWSKLGHLQALKEL
jgi:hypothetical protein